MFLCFSIPTLFCKESGTNGNDKQHVFVAIALQFGKVWWVCACMVKTDKKGCLCKVMAGLFRQFSCGYIFLVSLALHVGFDIADGAVRVRQ